MIQIQQELYKAQRDTQSKYVHFLLAAAVACLAYAMNQTRGEALHPAHFILAIALFLWATSFYYGCKHLQKVVTHMFWNQRMNDIEVAQNAPDQYIRGLLEYVSDEITKYFHRQFLFFVWGAFSYVVWHILEMALKNPIYAGWMRTYFPLL